MVDPIISGIASAMAGQATGTAIEQIRNALSEADDAQEAWKDIAKECAIQAKSAYYQHVHNVSLPDRTRAREMANSVGEVAQDLAVRGEARGYDEEDIQLVRKLAHHCEEYSNSPKMHSGSDEKAFKKAVDDLSERIFEMAAE